MSAMITCFRVSAILLNRCSWRAPALAENDLTIICNHYWMFFHPWRAEPNPPDIAAWNELLDDVLDKSRFEVTTFTADAGRAADSN